MGRFEERPADPALRPLTARAASILIGLDAVTPAGRFGQGRAIRLTHEQIAGLLGAAREATSKANHPAAETRHRL